MQVVRAVGGGCKAGLAQAIGAFRAEAAASSSMRALRMASGPLATAIGRPAWAGCHWRVGARASGCAAACASPCCHCDWLELEHCQ